MHLGLAELLIVFMIVLLLCGPVLGVVALLLLGRLGLRRGAAKPGEEAASSGDLSGKKQKQS